MARLNWSGARQRELARLIEQQERDAREWSKDQERKAPHMSKARQREWLSQKVAEYHGPVTQWSPWREIPQPFPSVAGPGAVAFERHRVRR